MNALTLTIGVLSACLTGCSPFGGGAFTCSTNEQCNSRGGGRCEPNGLCSYADASCESGQSYGENSGDLSGICVDEASPPDCYGDSSGLVRPCFQSPPTGAVVLPPMINTDEGSPQCSSAAMDAPGMCVIAGESIRVAVPVAVTGSRPLVLVATTRIEVMALLDAASHRSMTAPYTTVQAGAGSDPTGGCGAGTDPTNGGGAGGSLVAAGGNGGTGAGSGGTAAAGLTVTTLRGGCKGQDGAGGNRGTGGRGGGAVYLIAESAIDIMAVAAINASGEGGHPGVSMEGGAGGGGSGGMIGLDSPMINNGGVVFANGASGGEGSGSTRTGTPGPEPNSAAPSGPATGGSGSGGDSGGGGAGGTAGGSANGGNGQNSTAPGDGGGGGGGGGAGVIRVFRGTLGGSHSPLPS